MSHREKSSALSIASCMLHSACIPNIPFTPFFLLPKMNEKNAMVAPAQAPLSGTTALEKKMPQKYSTCEITVVGFISTVLYFYLLRRVNLGTAHN